MKVIAQLGNPRERCANIPLWRAFKGKPWGGPPVDIDRMDAVPSDAAKEGAENGKKKKKRWKAPREPPLCVLSETIVEQRRSAKTPDPFRSQSPVDERADRAQTPGLPGKRKHRNPGSVVTASNAGMERANAPKADCADEQLEVIESRRTQRCTSLNRLQTQLLTLQRAEASHKQREFEMELQRKRMAFHWPPGMKVEHWKRGVGVVSSVDKDEAGVPRVNVKYEKEEDNEQHYKQGALQKLKRAEGEATPQDTPRDMMPRTYSVERTKSSKVEIYKPYKPPAPERRPRSRRSKTPKPAQPEEEEPDVAQTQQAQLEEEEEKRKELEEEMTKVREEDEESGA